MTSTQTFTFKCYSLTDSESIENYKKALIDVGCDSAYYCYELLINKANNLEQLHFFDYRDEDGSVMAIMPFLLRDVIINDLDTGFKDVSSPWGYNGPFFLSGLSEDVVSDFWISVDSWYTENNVVSEFLRFNFFGNHTNYSGTALHTLLNVKGNITDWDIFWSNLKSNTRNQFRKAEKLGLDFQMSYGDFSEIKIKDFYKVYINTMNRRDAIDSFYHPLDYFINFWQENIKKCAIGLVYYNGIPISAELFLISDNTIFSFLGGTDSEYFKLRPNEFLKINAIQWGNKKGMDYYMIGGGLSNGLDDKLYQYKKKYFPLDDDIDFYTGRKIILPKVYLELLSKAGYKDVNNNALVDIETGYFPKYRDVKR